MKFKNLLVDRQERIMILTINRPEALNALNSEVFHEMDQLMAGIANEEDIRVVIITGSGKAFVAGADIAEMANKTPEEGSSFSRLGQNTFRSLERSEKIIIAAINGFALGGGLELAMACDFRIASEEARFGQPEVKLGMIPGFAGTQRLPRLTGMGNALYLLLSAEMIDAPTALRMGLIQKMTKKEELLTNALDTAKTILKMGPEALKKVKYVCRNGIEIPFEEGCHLEAQQFGTQFKAEGEEGMKAFLEKRKPNWYPNK